MEVTPSGMVYELSDLPAGYSTSVFMSLLKRTPSEEQYAVFPSATVTDEREVHL